MQYVLAEQERTLKEKNEAADKLIKIVGAENENVQKDKLIGMRLATNSKRRRERETEQI